MPLTFLQPSVLPSSSSPPSSPPSSLSFPLCCSYHLCQLEDGRTQGVDSAFVPRVDSTQEGSQLPQLWFSGSFWILGIQRTRGQTHVPGLLPSLGAPDTNAQCSVTVVKLFNHLDSVSILCEDTLVFCIINSSEVEGLLLRATCL